MRVTRIVIYVLFIIVVTGICFAQEELPEFRIGFFEGGEYPHFEALREAYRTQLLGLVEDKYKIIFPAVGFRSARWKRDTCKIYAQQLSQEDGVDIIVAMGAWVVQDLLEAGCKKPIIAAHQYDPIGSGLLNAARRPIAENLALTFDPFKMAREVTQLCELLSVKRLGVLHFPAGGPVDSTVSRIRAIAKRFQVEVVTAEGYDNYGTFAFFKAYKELIKKVDAIYVTPTQGLNTHKTSPFFEMLVRDRMPLGSSEGRFHVSRGGMLGFGSDNLLSEAFYNAHQTMKIIEGATPADLPIAYNQQAVLSINQATLARCKVELPNDVIIHADLMGEVEAADAVHLDLSTALFHGLSANPTLGAIQSKIAMVEAQSDQVKAGLLPQLAINGKIGWQGDNARNNSYNEANSDYRSLGLNLTQRLVDFGWWAKRDVKITMEEISKAELEIASSFLEESITQAYYEILRISENLDQLSQYRRRIDLFVELVQAKEQSGLITSGDRIRWQYDRLQVTKHMLELETDLRISTNSLNILLGQPPSMEVRLDPLAASLGMLNREYTLMQSFVRSKSLTRKTKVKLEDFALLHNPSLLLKKTNTHWAEEKIREANSSFYPKLGFTAGITLRDSLADNISEFSEKSPFWSAGINLSWPLFGSGASSADRRAARSRFDQAGFETDAERLAVLRRVSTATEVWLLQYHKLPLVEESYAQAMNYLNEMTAGYLSGKTSFSETKDALDLWFEAGLENTDIRYSYFLSSARLLLEIGGSMTETGASPGEAVLNYLSQ